MIEDVERWRRDLLLTGDLIQDGDQERADEERRTGTEYVELLELVEGTEGEEVFLAIIDSMSVPEDYGVYQSCLRVASRFPSERFGLWLFRALEDGWLGRDPDRAVDWLGQLAFEGNSHPAVLAFNVAWSAAQPDFSHALLIFVVEQEREFGWLAHPGQPGVLRPRP